MKMLKKLALVSAVSMISAGAFAMEALDEETMSATTGQDGITIIVAPGTRSDTQIVTDLGVSQATFDKIDLLNAAGAATPDAIVKGLSIRQVVIHDDDGWTNGATPFGGTYGGTTGVTDNSGAIVIGNGDQDDSTVVFADNTTPIRVVVDAVGDFDGAGAGTGAMLNVRISTPTLAIKVGSISVADSNAVAGATTATDTDGTAATGLIEIASPMEIILGATDINIQLGNESQGSMIVVNAQLQGGLEINNLKLNDINSGGSITASSLKLVDSAALFADGANLTANVRVDAIGSIGGTDTIGGLLVTLVSLGGVNGLNMTLNDQFIGNATAANQNTNNLGDIQIKGLDLSGTSLIIRGH